MITILGRPISKKNSRRNFGHVSLPSSAYCNFEKQALQQLLVVKERYQGRVDVKYTFYMKGRLDSDCDNMIGGINDLLQKAGVIEDDKFIVSGIFKKIAGNKDWKTEIEIKNRTIEDDYLDPI